jgi:diguanylate cyclase (GGDEF)-like protein
MFQLRFREAINHASAHGAKVGLLLLDLDHFKDVNDTLGHDAGDALLRSAAERLVQSFRATDTVARLGGDEFAVILPGLHSAKSLERPVQILLERLRRPVDHGGKTFSVTASVGGAVFPTHDADSEQLVKNADIALYEAKAAGRGRMVIFKPHMRTAIEERLDLLRDVRRGVSQNEFVLYYQPIMDIVTGSVVGFEGLMRWRHPERGLLTPEAFITAFEDRELAPMLTAVSFDGAMKQMRAWIERGVDFGRVAVNLSAAQFRTSFLAQIIEEKLRHWGVPPDRLTIEVTENVYMGWGSEGVGDTVRRLHEQGVLIALDDFGAGFASLSNLKTFPIDR